MTNDAEHEDDPATERAAERHDGPLQEGATPVRGDDVPAGVAPEDVEDHVGAEGGSGSSHTPTPFHPHKDDHSAFGDTDQHSKA